MSSTLLQPTQFEFKAINGAVSIDEAKGIVECFVAAFGNKDSVGDVIVSGAFDESLKRRKPRVVWGHDWNQPIGKVLEIYEVRPNDPRLPAKMKQAGVGGLYARVQFNLKSERGREAFANVAFFGEEQEWSIGYKTIDAVYDGPRKANVLKAVELYEVSPVLHGANQLTGTISVKSDGGGERVDSLQKSKWKMFDRGFAEMIKNEHPDIWDAGGNIKGDDQYEILTKIAKQGGRAKTEDQIKAIELREAWVARHKGNFQLAGVIAQIKWLAVGTRGEDFMKDVVREAIDKKKMRQKGQMGRIRRVRVAASPQRCRRCIQSV
jgi:HK97 family phage prohead protease